MSRTASGTRRSIVRCTQNIGIVPIFAWGDTGRSQGSPLPRRRGLLLRGHQERLSSGFRSRLGNTERSGGWLYRKPPHVAYPMGSCTAAAAERISLGSGK
jgi:hypothetical protein